MHTIKALLKNKPRYKNSFYLIFLLFFLRERFKLSICPHISMCQNMTINAGLLGVTSLELQVYATISGLPSKQEI